MNLEQIIETANDRAITAAEKVVENSNGSEAWQAVRIETKGNIKLQNQLKKLGYEKDAYWGYTMSAPFGGYLAKKEWCEVFANEMTEMGVKSRAVERLL